MNTKVKDLFRLTDELRAAILDLALAQEESLAYELKKAHVQKDVTVRAGVTGKCEKGVTHGKEKRDDAK